MPPSQAGRSKAELGNPNGAVPLAGEIGVGTELNGDLPEVDSGDILVVKGTWVYDSAHEGWNEIHPILHCQRIGTWKRVVVGYGVRSAEHEGGRRPVVLGT
jgi:hypothetical protein